MYYYSLKSSLSMRPTTKVGAELVQCTLVYSVQNTQTNCKIYYFKHSAAHEKESAVIFHKKNIHSFHPHAHAHHTSC